MAGGAGDADGLIPACAGKTSAKPPPTPPARDHPRVCGENRWCSSWVPPMGGSSPRVRGKLARLAHPCELGRLIPACAGKTGRTPGRNSPSRAHPRVCGENGFLGIHSPSRVGSSPRVRGKQDRAFTGHGRVRLIPACAGKTTVFGSTRVARAAHPRVCGENADEHFGVVLRDGSSPRVRGKRPPLGPDHSRRRLIPACAGKTCCGGATPSGWGAHPRVCGENAVAVRARVDGRGSSPRVRGKPIRHRPPPARRRLIPACAGKTVNGSTITFPSGAHPRVCGENAHLSSFCRPGRGSSPRVRGKPSGGVARAAGVGLIPACAGKTSPMAQAPASPPAHPRVCGENRGVALAGRRGGAHPRVCGENPSERRNSSNFAGSSPRVRGKLAPLMAPTTPLRLIPACAGKTSTASRPTAASTAHPRVCGENLDGLDVGQARHGSSPRVRGKPTNVITVSMCGRLIPACAGKTVL